MEERVNNQQKGNGNARPGTETQTHRNNSEGAWAWRNRSVRRSVRYALHRRVDWTGGVSWTVVRAAELRALVCGQGGELAIELATGCATQRDWYKEQAWTPDGFNYTLQRERATGDYSDYFGVSWSFK